MANSSKASANSVTTGRTAKKRIEPAFFSVDECEIITGLSKWTWRRMAYDGRIASAKVGARLLIPAAEVNKIMAAGLRPALPDAELVGAETVSA